MAWPPLTQFTKIVLGVIFGAFAALALAESATSLPLAAVLALDTHTLGVHTAWQFFAWPLVIPFAERAILDVALAMFFAYLIIAPFDARYGPKNALKLLGWSALGAGVAAIAAEQLLSLVFTRAGGLLTGSSPLLWGVLIGGLFASPGDRVMLFGRFEAKRWQILLGVLVFSIFPVLRTWGEFVADFFATWGAVGAAILWARVYAAPRRPTRKAPPKRPGHLKLVRGGRGGDGDEPPKVLH